MNYEPHPQEPFRLDARPVRPQKAALPAHDAPKFKQRVLFSGMECLPDQLDLFPTDGQAPEETEQ